MHQGNVKGKAEGAVVLVARRGREGNIVRGGGLLDGGEPEGGLAGVVLAMEIIQSARTEAEESEQSRDCRQTAHGRMMRGWREKINS